MGFRYKDTLTKIKEALVQQLDTLEEPYNINNQRLESLKLDKPLIQYYLTDTNRDNAFAMVKVWEHTVPVFISVSNKNQEANAEKLSDIVEVITELEKYDNLEFDIDSISYNNEVEKFNSLTTIIVFIVQEKCEVIN